MFAYPSSDYKRHSLRVWPIALLIALAALAFAGCGSGDERTAGSTETSNAPTDAEVIEGWAETLSEGDVDGAADYFAVPSSAQNGPIGIDIDTTEDAVAFNESLPCGARVIDTTEDGDRTIAEFRLTERPGGGCGQGVGGTASTAFVIENGKIVDWERVVGEDGPIAPPLEESEV